MPIVKTYYKVHRVFPDPDYFYMENTSGNTATFTVYKTGTPASTDLSYSLDKVTWTDIHNGGNITGVANGAKVYFRSSTGLSINSSNYFRFNSNFNFNVGGHAHTLLDYRDDTLSVLPSGCFVNMHNNSRVVHAGIDFSGITTVEGYSLNGTFLHCYSLITPPDCSSLTDVSANGMLSMFQNCTSLMTPVDLSNVTSVGTWGMSGLYYNCSVLNDAIAPNVSVWNTTAMSNWLIGTAATGVVRKPAGLTIPTDSVSGVPTGWETENY